MIFFHDDFDLLFDFLMFKASFKYYKSKSPPPCLKEVLDIDQTKELLEKSVLKQIHIICQDKLWKTFGMKSPENWEVFELIDHPGLIYIKNPYTNSGQKYWVIRSLRDFSKTPNKRNIDALGIVSENWWESAKNDKKTLMMLRWTTLGYHHNWDTKIYSEDNKGKFPEDLKNMTKFIAGLLGFEDFSAEAAIVNYYHMDSTLSGHSDQSEQYLEAPLFSFSFGQSAIFLLGGITEEEKPTAMFLKSGDIIVMSGKSRLSYHGVPKIVQTELKLGDEIGDENCNQNALCMDEDNWKPFSDYIAHSRINVNVRQVLRKGLLKLDDQI
ncbi:unnamed protein product [Phaedon cochleariae]|uniref:Fe2OG dioxygenase domain-containing protein n=1 Tax=Phaedon cochleariae TaxID=80249 RepID=A0A9P0DU91_PHACE|nr:unnamed protein product [Phaedon cochleariae]